VEAQPWKMVLQCYLSDVIRQFADKGAEHEFQKEKDTSGCFLYAIQIPNNS
jgi:hypothetical protein